MIDSIALIAIISILFISMMVTLFFISLLVKIWRGIDYMSMRRANDKRTICEVLREINDLHQGNTDHDSKIRYKLFECELMAKKMTRKLITYNKEWDSKFWADNPDFEKDLLKRLDTSYLTGQPIDTKEQNDGIT